MVRKEYIHGYQVTFEENAKEGAEYLHHDLEKEETMVFFEQARDHGSAQFEDDHDRQYTLIFQNGTYVLTRR